MKNICLNVLLVLLLCSCSSIPIPMVPHFSHIDGDYYWHSGTAVMVSFTDSTNVALSAQRVGDEIHATVYVRNQSRSPFNVDTENVTVTAIVDDGEVVDRDFPCIRAGRESLVAEGVKMPQTQIMPVLTAREYLKKTESQHIEKSILTSVRIGLETTSYKSETAQAITLQSGINRSQAERISQQQLLDELQSGLFQRHTVFPGSSYMGSVRFPVFFSDQAPGDARRSIYLFTKPQYPSTAFFQVCITCGPDEHRFLIKEETDIDRPHSQPLLRSLRR